MLSPDREEKRAKCCRMRGTEVREEVDVRMSSMWAQTDFEWEGERWAGAMCGSFLKRLRRGSTASRKRSPAMGSP